MFSPCPLFNLPWDINRSLFENVNIPFLRDISLLFQTAYANPAVQFHRPLKTLNITTIAVNVHVQGSGLSILPLVTYGPFPPFTS